MRRPLLFALAFSVAIPAFAVNLSPNNLPYSDTHSGSAESVAISVLTNEGVVGGYPDGTFRPNRTLNRAEFLKIVLESRNTLTVSADDAQNCFPDVKQNDWFSRYVCFAKTHGFIGGYPDGTFKPANTVNHAEALKMIATIYGYETEHHAQDEWFDPYVRAATSVGIALPTTLAMDAKLTRGQMARLTAAALSEADGMLQAYRAAERGEVMSSSSSSPSSSSSSISSSSSSSTSSASSSSLFTLPVASHFLVTGTASDAIAYGTTTPQPTRTIINSAKIILISEALSLSGIDLVTLNGQKIMSLKRRTTADTDEYRKIYEFTEQISGSGFSIPANQALPIIARAVVKPLGGDGASNQLVQMRSFVVNVFDPITFQTFNYSFSPPFPQHQTALGKITRVVRVGPETGTLRSGTGVLVGSFSFAGLAASGQTMTMITLAPSLQSSGVSFDHWTISSPDLPGQSECAFSSGIVTCVNMGSFAVLPAGGTPRVLEIRANVVVDPTAQNPFMSLSLDQAGLPSSPGSIAWTDGSTTFNWVEGSTPLALGTKWQK